MGTILSKYHNMPKGTLQYPSVCIDHEFPEELPVLLDAMLEGDLPVVIQHQGQLIQLEKKVARTPTNFNILLKLYPIVVFLEENETVRVTTIVEMLELEGFNWMQSM